MADFNKNNMPSFNRNVPRINSSGINVGGQRENVFNVLPIHQHSHLQMQQQMYMDRNRNANYQASDIYWSELHHSTWQVNGATHFIAAQPPPSQPSVNMPPPPRPAQLGLFAPGPVYSAAYAAAYQTNTGFIGSCGAVMTSTINTGAISTGAPQIITTNSPTGVSSTAASTTMPNNLQPSLGVMAAAPSITTLTENKYDVQTNINANSSGETTDENNIMLRKPSTADAFTQTNVIPKSVTISVGVDATKYEEETMPSQMHSATPRINITNADAGPYGAGDGVGSSSYIDEITLQNKLKYITEISLCGCRLGEYLATRYQNRPCFKKMDSLCARIKQDLLRPDNVLANINSQGLAWAVKDFIFVFTRIVNAWAILKGYNYNMDEVMKRIRNMLPKDFGEEFLKWQERTSVLIGIIIRGCLRLHAQDTNQRAQDNVPLVIDDTNDILTLFEKCLNDTEAFQNIMNVFGENSEEQQPNANGTYFKTGMYQPLQKLEKLLDDINFGRDMPSHNQMNPSNECNNLHNPPHLAANIADPTQLTSSADFTPVAPICEMPAANYSMHSIENNNNCSSIGCNCNDNYNGSRPHDFSSSDIGVISTAINQADEFECFDPYYTVNSEPYSTKYIDWEYEHLQPVPKPKMRLNVNSPFGQQMYITLQLFCNRIEHMSSSEMFYRKDFTKNFFPDYISRCRHDFCDLHQIINLALNCNFAHLYEAIHNVRKLIRVTKKYLHLYPNEQLAFHTKNFEGEFNHYLNEKPFIPHQFDHIRGITGEPLFNYTI